MAGLIVGGAVGTGFLDPAILVTAMNFGAGEDDLESPWDTAMVDFEIEKIRGIESQEFGDKLIWKNLVTNCWVKGDKVLQVGTKIFCKLTDMNDSVIAESFVTVTDPCVDPEKDLCVQGPAPANTGFQIHIPKSTPQPFAFDVQDVIILVVEPGITGMQIGRASCRERV